jgi:hypothetical protein
MTGGNQDSVDLAIELLLWSKDLVLCTNGPLTCDRKTVETIRRLDIRVIETPISGLEGKGGQAGRNSVYRRQFPPAKRAFFLTGAVPTVTSGGTARLRILRG